MTTILLLLTALATECEASPHHHEMGMPQSHGSQVAAHSSNWQVTRRQVSNGATATIISNFLPPHVADHWHNVLNASWTRAAPCITSEKGCTASSSAEKGEGGFCSWLYTTNSHGGNQKIRSVWTREQRKREATETYRRNGFAYSKWELTAGHELYKAAGLLMEDRAVRHAIASAQWPEDADKPDIGSHLGNISDYFVTAYSDGDFLSTHSDGASGSLAWVLHLTPEQAEWDSGSGGELRFNPGAVVRANSDFAPAYNRLLLFLTRPDFTPHQVMPVRRPASAEPRFGATGWYMTRGDRFSAAVQRENDAMRAAASKASSRNGDVCI